MWFNGLVNAACDMVSACQAWLVQSFLYFDVRDVRLREGFARFKNCFGLYSADLVTNESNIRKISALRNELYFANGFFQCLLRIASFLMSLMAQNIRTSVS